MKKIRLWTLGNLDYQVVPTKEAIEALKQEIRVTVGHEDDVVNFVWGPELEVRVISEGDTFLKVARMTRAETILAEDKTPQELITEVKKSVEEQKTKISEVIDKAWDTAVTGATEKIQKKVLSEEQIECYKKIAEEG